MEYICRECDEPGRRSDPCRANLGGGIKNMIGAKCFWPTTGSAAKWVPIDDDQASGTSCPMCKRVHDMNMACKEWVKARTLGVPGRVEGEKVQGRRVGKRNRRTSGLCNPHPQAGERRLVSGFMGRRRSDYVYWADGI